MNLRFIILLLLVGAVGVSLAVGWTAHADDSGSDPTGVPNPPPYTGPAPTSTVVGWQPQQPDSAP